MLFNSASFLLVFLPLVVLGYHIISARHRVAGQWFLVLASLVFYGFWKWALLPVLLVSVFINYHIASYIIRHNAHKRVVILGIAFNLGLLAYYKYAGFFAGIFNALGASLTIPDIVLPLAISFFTFQQIAYLVDAHKGLINDHHLRSYCLFVVFFPQLIAGPIVHHREMMPQFQRPLPAFYFDSADVAKGLVLLFVGLFQKVLIADPIGTFVNPLFDQAQQLTFWESWTGALGYTLQLYADFNGYCLMAMGIALLFGIKLPLNFNSPYQAINIADFWRRWHITLGRFLRDYLYIPLGGNRHGKWRLFMAIAVTMVLGGLWHGAAWSFVLWGCLHGLFIFICHLWTRTPYQLPTWFSRTLTLTAVVFAWVLFRANSVSDALIVWETMLGLHGLVLPAAFESFIGSTGLPISFYQSNIINGLELLLLGALLYCTIVLPNIHTYLDRLRPVKRHAMALVGLACVGIFSLNNPSTFLYFNF